eukprot:TRINITY_DN23811_c0_g1_i2.p1 TRINITY_DN23811_c0_g1~~TRINITY_DN23811_c0_g1_i2.p1  ORF type:complete len:618 (+),score=157.18 TRINITY_DN23811_c0_g1_i2:168-2021(+)
MKDEVMVQEAEAEEGKSSQPAKAQDLEEATARRSYDTVGARKAVLADRLQAFQDTKFLQQVHEATGVSVEDLQLLQGDDLQASFRSLGKDLSGEIDFQEFIQDLLKIRAKRGLASAENAKEQAFSQGELKRQVAQLTAEVLSLQKKLDYTYEEVERCDVQSAQTVTMVERLSGTLHKQAVDNVNLEQAFLKCESKIIGLEASTVSVLEARLRAFVKAEVKSAFSATQQAVERQCRELYDAMEVLRKRLTQPPRGELLADAQQDVEDFLQPARLQPMPEGEVLPTEVWAKQAGVSDFVSGSSTFEPPRDTALAEESPLIEDVLAGDVSRATVVLQQASVAQLIARDKEGCTALHRAAAMPGLGRIRAALLEYGGVRLASARDLHLRTALHHAALAGCVDGCEQLLDAPIFQDADRRAMHGRTALHLAAEYGHSEVCRALLSHVRFTAASVGDDFQHTALHHAAINGHLAACQALLEHPRFQAVSSKDQDGWTALHWSASSGYAGLCQILLDNRNFSEAAVTAKTARGWSALHLAATHGCEEACHVLLTHPRFSAVADQDIVGRNALHAAAEAGHGNICRLFLASKNFDVLVTAKDVAGHTPDNLATGSALEVPLHVRR